MKSYPPDLLDSSALSEVFHELSIRYVKEQSANVSGGNFSFCFVTGAKEWRDKVTRARQRGGGETSSTKGLEEIVTEMVNEKMQCCRFFGGCCGKFTKGDVRLRKNEK